MFIMRDARLNTLKFFAKPFAKGYGWGGDQEGSSCLTKSVRMVMEIYRVTESELTFSATLAMIISMITVQTFKQAAIWGETFGDLPILL